MGPILLSFQKAPKFDQLQQALQAKIEEALT
jgi:hypothetical protein